MANSDDIPIPRTSQPSSNPFLDDSLQDEAGCDVDLLSNSYSEINFNYKFGMQRNSENMNQESDRESPKYDKMDVEEDECSDKEPTTKPRPNSLVCDKKEMSHFVADNIELLIKNSPISKFGELIEFTGKSEVMRALHNLNF
jgi:hypothetical protein